MFIFFFSYKRIQSLFEQNDLGGLGGEAPQNRNFPYGTNFLLRAISPSPKRLSLLGAKGKIPTGEIPGIFLHHISDFFYLTCPQNPGNFPGFQDHMSQNYAFFLNHRSE